MGRRTSTSLCVPLPSVCSAQRRVCEAAATRSTPALQGQPLSFHLECLCTQVFDLYLVAASFCTCEMLGMSSDEGTTPGGSSCGVCLVELCENPQIMVFGASVIFYHGSTFHSLTFICSLCGDSIVSTLILKYCQTRRVLVLAY